MSPSFNVKKLSCYNSTNMRTKLSKKNPLLQKHLMDERFTIKQKDFDDLLMKAAKPAKPLQKTPEQAKHQTSKH